MISRREIVEEARRYLDTPFKHMGRIPGVGLDCAGVVVCIAQNLGLSGDYVDLTYYPRDPVSMMMTDIIEQHMDKIPVSAATAGDVIHIAWAKYPQHLAVMSGDETIIHAHEDAGRVVETHLGIYMQRCIRGVYRFRGVA